MTVRFAPFDAEPLGQSNFITVLDDIRRTASAPPACPSPPLSEPLTIRRFAAPFRLGLPQVGRNPHLARISPVWRVKGAIDRSSDYKSGTILPAPTSMRRGNIRLLDDENQSQIPKKGTMVPEGTTVHVNMAVAD